MPVLGISAAVFTTAATAATATAATTAAASAAATAAMTATLTSIAVKVAVNVVLSAALSLLQPNVGAAGRTFEWTLDPDGPIPFAAGRVGVAGSAVYRRTFGSDLMYYGIPSVLSGSGPIDGYEGFMADDEAVTFDATGKAITSQYAGELWYRTRLGSQPDTALPSPSGLKNNVGLIGWTAANRLSGKASYLIVMGENSKGTAYPTGEIKPIITFRGLKGWDPRLDTTYPGGSGQCRLHDPSTWVYITNPILWALKWSLGLWEGPTGKGAPQVDYQVGGIGAKLSGIDVPAFVAAANVADANGWTVAAYPTTDDDKAQVLDAFLQAGGAIYAQRAGKISCIQRAAPRASVVTISASDTAGPLEIDTAASRIDRINTIRPRFWSEAHRWQMTALPEVTAAAYQADDGAKRTRGLDLHYVSNAKQAAQLAALQIANTREGIAGVIPLKPHLQRIRPGDAFTITEPGFVLNGLKCLCLNTDYDPATGVVRVSFVSETDAKYAFAMGQSPTPPAPPVLTPVDQSYVSPPLLEDWNIVVRPPAPGGTQLPGFDVSGIVSNSTATAIIVEWGLPPDPPPPEPLPEGKVWADYVTWTTAYQGPPTVTNIPIDGLQPGQTYYVAIQNQRNQNYSAREVWGPYVAPALIAGGLAPDAAQELIDEATKEVEDKVKEALDQLEQTINLDGLFDGQDDLAEAILKLGRGQTELQRIMETHTRDGGTLVKSIVRVIGGELENAQGAIVQEATLSLQRDQAEAIIREALALQVNQNRASAESSISALVTASSAQVTSLNAIGVRVGNTESAISNEAMVRASETGGLATTLSLMGVRNGSSSGFILNQNTLQWGAEGTLAQVLAGLRATDGSNSSSIVSLQQATSGQASQLTTLSNTTAGQTLSISQLLSVTAGLGSRYTLQLDGNGAATSFIADGQTRAIIFNAASLSIIDDGNGLSYQPATGRLKIVRGTKKTVLGAGSGLILWAGNTSIADGFEVVDNGDLGIGSGDAWFGGRTISGPFDSGAASGEIDLAVNNVIAIVPSKMMQASGFSSGQVTFDIFVSGSPADPGAPDYGFVYSVIAANQDGSGEVVLFSNFQNGTPNAWLAVNVFWPLSQINTTRANKKIFLRISNFGSDVRVPRARSARIRGLYGA